MSQSNPTDSSSNHLRQRSQVPPLPTDSEDPAMFSRSNNSNKRDLRNQKGDEFDSIQMENGDSELKDKKVDGKKEVQPDLPKEDRDAILLLVVLYMLQGVPIGLAFGTMPFLLKSHSSYSDIAIFALSTYPYSLKLFWSPIVDSIFVENLKIGGLNLSLGRRKSWIVPIQMMLGGMLWVLSGRIEEIMNQPTPDVKFITLVFFVLIFFAATQDIAVDGWALTLLSQENVGYASTAQTVGINIGYFMSFTVFLALNSVEFANKYFRSTPLDTPMLTLGGYLHFWSYAFLAVTAWLLVMKKEDVEPENQEDMDLVGVYKSMFKVVKLKNVQTFIFVHLIAKIGFQANEGVTSLKLVEKGFAREDLALAVLIDFPFQLVLGYLAAKWSRGTNALNPWLYAFAARLVFAVLSIALVAGVPDQPIGYSYFILVILFTVTSSFASTVQFVGISAFHTQIADPLIGGTYMTLLNTVSNLGGTWPRFFVFKSVDHFTISNCVPSTTSAKLVEHSKKLLDSLNLDENNTEGLKDCVSDKGREICESLGGKCLIEKDGYFITSWICVFIGAITLVAWIYPMARKLQGLPLSAWRVTNSSGGGGARRD